MTRMSCPEWDVQSLMPLETVRVSVTDASQEWVTMTRDDQGWPGKRPWNNKKGQHESTVRKTRLSVLSSLFVEDAGHWVLKRVTVVCSQERHRKETEWSLSAKYSVSKVSGKQFVRDVLCKMCFSLSPKVSLVLMNDPSLDPRLRFTDLLGDAKTTTANKERHSHTSLLLSSQRTLQRKSKKSQERWCTLLLFPSTVGLLFRHVFG